MAFGKIPGWIRFMIWITTEI